ncbi:hypothetical protein NDU88_001887 [Pleurodeles waltl]|uniref:Gypsy retrotransposon integrase-like protein 1 n=1 Tax=Pleurodeles waltl TaxID=8319 RepID=A0AAV7UTZ2_PLEWA|nr:hypothetical protein NDU88_001887 [Pleurodeles waltl]
MSDQPSLEDMIKQLAEGQRHLQLVWEAHQREAKEDREALQSALKSQATILANNQLVHETAMKKFTETIASSKVHPNVPSSVLQKYQDGEDPEAFFTNFERVASSAQWPEDRWGQYVANLLTGLLQAAYQAANPGGTTPYQEIKTSILERVGHDTEYYRVKLRKIKWGPNEDPRTFYYRVKDLALKWLGSSGNSREEVIQTIVLEQYLESLPTTTKHWIRQHPKVTTEMAIDLACAYHRSTDVRNMSPRPSLKPGTSTPKITPRTFAEETIPHRFPNPSLPVAGPQCYNCGEWGHIARMCPRRQDSSEPMEIGVTRRRVLGTGKGNQQFKQPLKVNGKTILALIDSGCSQSVVRKDIIPIVDKGTEQWVNICCIHGDKEEYPLYNITVEWGIYWDVLPMGLMSNLIEECIIGTDYEHFQEILDYVRQPTLTQDWWRDAPFSDSSIESPTIRRKLSRREKRIEKSNYLGKESSGSDTSIIAETHEVPVSFPQQQRTDPSLAHAWKSAREEETEEVGPYFLIKKNLLYRITTTDTGEHKQQLVVPDHYRNQVLTMAHCQPGGGHYGREKTEEYLLRRFYWPGVFTHIRMYRVLWASMCMVLHQWIPLYVGCM